MERWFPVNTRNKPIRKYLNVQIWAKQQQWPTKYFPETFSVEASSTQRAEGLHSLLKKMTGCSSAVELVQNIEIVTQKQFFSDAIFGRPKIRTQPFCANTMLGSGKIKKAVLERCLSRFANLQMVVDIESVNTSSHGHGNQGIFLYFSFSKLHLWA